MIVKPDKFQEIINDKRKGDHTNENVVIDNKQILIIIINQRLIINQSLLILIINQSLEVPNVSF